MQLYVRVKFNSHQTCVCRDVTISCRWRMLSFRIINASLWNVVLVLRVCVCVRVVLWLFKTRDHVYRLGPEIASKIKYNTNISGM